MKIKSRAGTKVFHLLPNRNRPIVTIVIVPGICSSSESGSIRHFTKRCSEGLNCRTVVFNPRGCTGEITVSCVNSEALIYETI